MKHVLLLAGANPKNKEWIYKLRDKLAPTCSGNVSVFEYSHWSDSGDIDLSEEAAKLTKRLAAGDVSVVIAKSAGSLIALEASRASITKPGRAVFIGFPIKYAQEKNIDCSSLLSVFDTPTLYIQAEHDPMGSYRDICEITKNLANAKSVSIKGDDHDYKDMDELVRFCMVKYNHER